MASKENLRYSRDLLLKLHKELVDRERAKREELTGPMTASAFLGLLLEDEAFKWLRLISTLIVDIDEMFAQKDSIEQSSVDLHFGKMKELLSGTSGDADFDERYKTSLQESTEAASLHSELRGILSKDVGE